MRLTKKQADKWEAELRRVEANPQYDKHAYRLFLQEPMECGHAIANLLTCPDPPYGCLVCLRPEKIIEGSIYDILEAIGEDPERDGLKETPARVAKSYLEDFCRGYEENPLDFLKTFDNHSYSGIVLLKDIEFTSLCEHHLLVFQGHVHVAYIPSENRIVGLSKIGRVVEAYARRLQVQERLTSQIADCLDKGLKPKGVLVTIAAEHSCMSIRGIQKAGSLTVTSEIRGLFQKDASAKAEVFQLLRENLKG